MNNYRRLVFDIETVSVDFDSLDKTTQETLTRWIKRETQTKEEFEAELHNLKDGLGFSPLTGEIVVIGVLDCERDKGAVYYQAPGQVNEDFTEMFDGREFAFKQMSEEEMLRKFWDGASEYQEFITFNGRGFDVPFLMVRSAVYGIRSSRDLISNRYLSKQWHGVLHIDLQDQLTFYGAMRRKGSLHLWSRLFDIKSPKSDGVTGDDVGKLFREGEYLKIARYNTGDLNATRDLYEKWDRYVRF